LFAARVKKTLAGVNRLLVQWWCLQGKELMSHQENGRTKHFRLRMPMELYWQLKKDAEAHNVPPATRARHILCDALMDVQLTQQDYKKIAQAIRDNWRKIRGEHDENDSD